MTSTDYYSLCRTLDKECFHYYSQTTDFKIIPLRKNNCESKVPKKIMDCLQEQFTCEDLNNNCQHNNLLQWYDDSVSKREQCCNTTSVVIKNLTFYGQLYEIIKVCCECNNNYLLQYLCDEYSINDYLYRENNYCIRTAMVTDNREVVELLLKRQSVNPYDKNCEAIFKLWENGNISMLTLIHNNFKPITYEMLYNNFKNLGVPDASQLSINMINSVITTLPKTCFSIHPSQKDLITLLQACKLKILNQNDANKIWNSFILRKYILQEDSQIINYLLTFPNIDAANFNNWCLRWAIENNNFEIVRSVLNKENAKLSSLNWKPIKMSFANTEMFQFIINCVCDKPVLLLMSFRTCDNILTWLPKELLCKIIIKLF
jgi:hypothetical protein